MTSEWTLTEDDQEIHDALDELNFITFCETVIEEIETKERSY